MADNSSPSLPAQAGQFVLLHARSAGDSASTDVLIPTAGVIVFGAPPAYRDEGINARVILPGSTEFFVTETPAQVQQAILDQAVQGFERILPKMMVATLKAACMVPLVQEAAENNPDFLLGVARESGVLSPDQLQEMEAEAASRKARRR